MVVVILAAGLFGFWFFGRLIAVPLMFGLASLVTLACAHVRERRILRHAMVVAIILVWISVAIITTAAALEMLNFGRGVSSVWEISRWFGTVGSLALLASLVPVQWGLLALLRLVRPANRAIRLVAQCMAVLCFGVLALDIWTAVTGATYLVVGLIALIHLGAMVAFLHARRTGWRPSRVVEYAFVLYMLLVAGLIWQWDLIALLVELTLGPIRPRDWTESVLILITAATLLATGFVPALALLEFLARKEEAGSLPAMEVRVNMECPRCHAMQAISTGGDACVGCGLKFTLDIEEPRCSCGYLLYQLHEGHCPECGRVIASGRRKAEFKPDQTLAPSEAPVTLPGPTSAHAVSSHEDSTSQ
jgi:hypothetical protein